MDTKNKREGQIKTVLLGTKISTIVMMFFCAVSIVFGYYICLYSWGIDVVGGQRATNLIPDLPAFVLFVIDFYICICFAIVILVGVWLLLRNLEAGEVFVRKNTKLLNLITLGCVGIAIFCFIGGLVSLSTVLIGAVGLFMALIVQCVKVLMDKAIDLREELDLTI
ncbi:MAG: DUF2975 domain-containing protein [Clostridiales bacterium]|nr:DUF2975 domain-containing protein [Clostridiales bacterium]